MSDHDDQVHDDDRDAHPSTGGASPWEANPDPWDADATDQLDVPPDDPHQWGTDAPDQLTAPPHDTTHPWDLDATERPTLPLDADRAPAHDTDPTTAQPDQRPADDAIDWPTPLSPEDARTLLVEHAPVSARRRAIYRTADLVTTDASVATFTLRMLREFRTFKAGRRRCDDCGGRGRITCDGSAGRDHAGCTGCDGSGRQPCPSCAGSGKRVVDETPVASTTSGKRTATYGRPPAGARTAQAMSFSFAGQRIPGGLPADVAQVVAPLLAADEHELSRRLDVEVTPVTKVDVWDGERAFTAWIVGTDRQLVDARVVTTRRRRRTVAAAVMALAVMAGGPVGWMQLRPTLVAAPQQVATSGSENEAPSAESADASEAPPVLEVAEAHANGLERWRSLGILDGSDADLVDRDGSPVRTFLEAWEQELTQVPGGAVTDDALAQAQELGMVEADAVDLLGCAFSDDVPEGFTPLTAAFTCVFDWDGASLEVYVDGGLSAGYAVTAVTRDLRGADGTPTPPLPIEEAPPVVRLDGDSRIGLRGIGSVAIGMTISEAERASGMSFEVEGFDTFGGMCYFAHVPGLQDNFDFLIESPDGYAVSDPRDGVIARVSTGSWMASPAQTLSGIGVGDGEADVWAAYPDQITWEPHVYIEGGSYLTFTPRDTDDQAFRVRFFTDGYTVQEIHAGFTAASGYIEGCA